jgi:hypothetical protein
MFLEDLANNSRCTSAVLICIYAMNPTCAAANSEVQEASLSDSSCLLEVSDKLLSLSCFIVAATSAPAAEESYIREYDLN